MNPIARPSRRLAAAAALAGAAAAAPAHATLIEIDPCDETCTITASPPSVVTEDPNAGILLAWNERQNVTLTADLAVDRVFDSSASFVGGTTGSFVIEAGTVVSSHYLQWDPSPSGDTRIEATVRLDSQVFAFITSDANLFASDAALGLPGVDYNDFVLRGIENTDTTTFTGSDAAISWNASSPGDWARLITAFSPAAEVPVPAALPLLAGALGALGLAARRRRV